MKHLLAFFTVLVVSVSCFGQRLSLVGSNFSFAKGTIDVEVLTQIIEQKQSEVMERVFRNMVIKNLKYDTHGRKSFSTYYYIYNILTALTTEKNKTVITRQIINNLFEYCLVYGFTREFIMTVNPTTNGSVDSAFGLTNSSNLFYELERVPPNNGGQVFLKDKNGKDWKAFNYLLDMAFDIFLKDTSASSLHEKGLFTLLKNNPTLGTWYEKDNQYLSMSGSAQFKTVREQMEARYNAFKTKSFGGTDLIAVYTDLDTTDFRQESITKAQYDAVKRLLRNAIRALKTYSDNNIIGNISDFLLDYTLIEFAPPNNTDGTGATKDSTIRNRGILYIDAEGLIANLYDKYASNTKRSTIAKKGYWAIPRPFMVIGATHSGALSENNQLLVEDGTSSDLKSIYFANEKIGLKFTFVDRMYTRSFQPGEEYFYHGRKAYWISPQEVPLISRYELFLYGSGLLYNIVDIKSEKNFDYTLIGSAFGITFFNGLMLNAGLALPVNATGDLSEKYMYTFSFDVPIIEYLTAVRKKRNK